MPVTETPAEKGQLVTVAATNIVLKISGKIPPFSLVFRVGPVVFGKSPNPGANHPCPVVTGFTGRKGNEHREDKPGDE
jgi:hypothetical protein